MSTEPKATEAIAVSPRMATRKYSDGPNISETVASGGASSSRTKPLISPPTTEAKVEMRIASIALPRLVISKPSMDEAADAEVPGARSRIAEKEPP